MLKLSRRYARHAHVDYTYVLAVFFDMFAAYVCFVIFRCYGALPRRAHQASM